MVGCTKKSNFKMSLQTLEKCDEHFYLTKQWIYNENDHFFAALNSLVKFKLFYSTYCVLYSMLYELSSKTVSGLCTVAVVGVYLWLWLDVPMSGRCGMEQRVGDAWGFTPVIREPCAMPAGPPAGDTFSPAHLTTRLWSQTWRQVSSKHLFL